MCIRDSSQLDRFLMRLSLGHPPPEAERELLQTRGLQSPLHGLLPVASAEDLLAIQRRAAGWPGDPRRSPPVEARAAGSAARASGAARAPPPGAGVPATAASRSGPA